MLTALGSGELRPRGAGVLNTRRGGVWEQTWPPPMAGDLWVFAGTDASNNLTIGFGNPMTGITPEGAPALVGAGLHIALMPHPTLPVLRALFVRSGTCHFTDDFGATWSTAPAPSISSAQGPFYFPTVSGSRLHLVGYQSSYVSDDAGETWVQKSTSTPRSPSQAPAMVAVPHTGTIIFGDSDGGSLGKRLYKTTDGNDSRSIFRSNIVLGDTGGPAAALDRDVVMVTSTVSSSSNTIYRITNYGATQATVYQQAKTTDTDVVNFFHVNDTWIALRRDGQALVSRDDGASWTLETFHSGAWGTDDKIKVSLLDGIAFLPGRSGRPAYYTDGTTWVEVPKPDGWTQIVAAAPLTPA